MGKKYTTNFLEDTNGSTGASNQVLISTPSGIDWVDGSGSSIIGGPYVTIGTTQTITGTKTFAGSIGIGATSSNTFGGASKLFVDIGTGQGSIRLQNGNTDGVYFRRHTSGGNYQFQTYSSTNNTGVLSLQPFGGNVGIGTTSPGSKLTVNGSFSADTGSFSNELTLSSNLRLQNNITILNKAQTAYISFATRNTTGSEVVMDLTNVGSINGGAAGPYLPLTGGTMTAGAVVTFLDSSGSTDDRLKFGSSGDMQLFHDGTASHIVSSGSDLRIDAPNFIVRSAGGTESIIRASQNAAVELYYNNTKKFETTDLGVTFSNLATTSAASSSVDEVKIGSFGAGRPAIFLGTSNTTYSNSTWFIENIGASGKFRIGRNGLDVVEISNTGNTTFAGTISSGTHTIGNSGTSRFTDTSAFPLQLNRGLAVDVHGTNGVVLGLGSYSTGTTYVDAARIAANLESATSGDLFLQVNNSGTYTNALTINNDTNATFAGNITTSSSSAVIQTPRISMEADGTLDWGANRDYGTLTWDTNKIIIRSLSGKAMEFQTNGSTTALTLDTSQNATFAGVIKTANGSATTPAHNFSSHNGNGMYLEDYDASNNKEQVSIATDGARRIRINEAGLFADNNLYFANQIRKFGEWHATSGISGQGFKFTNTADSIDVLTITSAGNATFAGSLNVGPGPSRFTDQQNAGSRLELYNNRQDAGNVEVYRIAAYNSVEVAGIHFYRGGGGNSGYSKIFAKKNNASNLEEVVQFGTNDALTTTFAGNVITTGTSFIGKASTSSYLPDDGVFGGIITNGGGFKITTQAIDTLTLSAVGGNMTVRGEGTFGNTLTVNTANSNILTLNRTTSAGGYMRFQNDGTDKLYIGSRGTVSGSGGTGYDIYAVGGNDIRFFPGTLLALTLDTSQNAFFAGKVGIGTVSPTEKLDISGTAIVRSTLFTVGNVHGFNPSFGASFFINNSGGTSYFNATGGNVGIGTTSPSQLLHVKSTTSNATGIGLQNSERYYSVRSNNFSLVFTDETVGTERMRITSAGNLQVSNGKVQLTSQPTTQLEMFTNQLTLTAGGNQIFTGANGAQDSVTLGRSVGDTDIKLLGGSGNKFAFLEGSSGNFGIGTTSPSAKLTVADGMDGSNSQTGLEFIPQDSSNRNIILSYNRSSNAYKELNFDANNFAFNPSGNTKVVINSNGNVGIGTTSPGAKLDVAGSINTNGSINLTNAGVNTIAASNSNNGYLRFLVDQQGVALTLNADTSSTFGGIIYAVDGNKGAPGISFANDTDTGIFRDSSDKLAFATGANTRMIIESNGEVGINQPNPSATLHLRALTTNGVPFKLEGNANTTVEQMLIITSKAFNSSDAWYNLVAQAGDGSGGATNTIIIERDGDVRNKNNSYGQISDIRLKENITDATPKLEDIKKLKVKNFNLIGDDLKQIGLIAQEVEEVFPGLVKEDKQPDINGEEGGVYKSVKYSVLVPMLIKAMQEQQEQIDELKKQINN